MNIALQNAIDDLGDDVLKSPYLVNNLQDYRAFAVHDAGVHQAAVAQWEAVEGTAPNPDGQPR